MIAAFMRRLPLAGWFAVAAAGCAVLWIVGHGLGLRWDPFGQTERRLRAAEARAGQARSDAVARRLEAEGEADQARRLQQHHHQTLAVARVTERAVAQARSAHDADLPLDPARAARLGDHDRRLCELQPALCAAAAPDPADGGDDALPS